MGCCLSSSTSSSPNRAPPPPPPLEQESVKQVLSETPIPKPQSNFNAGPLSNSIHPTQHQISHLSQTLNNIHHFQHIPHRISTSPPKFPHNRSLSHDSSPRTDRSVGKSPTRKSQQFPGRITGGALKLVQSRDMGPSLRPDPRLQSRTESSYRRSRSPATTRTDGVLSRTAAGRSPSVRRSGMSPGRDYYRKEAPQAQAAETTNESLDNPFVSLECFIFL